MAISKRMKLLWRKWWYEYFALVKILLLPAGIMGIAITLLLYPLTYKADFGAYLSLEHNILFIISGIILFMVSLKLFQKSNKAFVAYNRTVIELTKTSDQEMLKEG